MKRISFLLAFVVFFTTVSFAKTAYVKTIVPKSENTIVKEKSLNGADTKNLELNLLKGKSCTVKATWTTEEGETVSFSVKVDCTNCTTTQEACDMAYKIVSIAIPD